MLLNKVYNRATSGYSFSTVSNQILLKAHMRPSKAVGANSECTELGILLMNSAFHLCVSVLFLQRFKDILSSLYNTGLYNENRVVLNSPFDKLHSLILNSYSLNCLKKH